MSVRPLPDDLQKKAIEELNEDPKRVKEDLKYIKIWLNQQVHLTVRTDDQWLISFLRCAKFSLEKTKERIDFYHTVKTLSPEIYGNRDPLGQDIQNALISGVVLPLKRVDNVSPRIFLIRLAVGEKYNVTTKIVFKLISMLCEILMMEDDSFVIIGTGMVFDMKGMGISHAKDLQPVLTKKMMTCYQQGYGFRIKELHFVNPTAIFDAINSLLRPFFSEKLKSRITIHPDVDDLCKNVPLSILPDEYGGQAGKVDDLIGEWKKKVESYRDWFLQDKIYKSDESKRPGASKNEETLFGISGSFRKLDVD